MTTKQITSRLRNLRQLRRDERGAYMIEFALVMPTFLLLTMATFDFGMQMYAKAVLAGAVEEAARASTLEASAANQSAVDDKVRAAVGRVASYALLSFDRSAYQDFSSVGKPEDFTDTNGNGVRNPGECYQDANGNGQWDNDRGEHNNGGAGDAVLYRVTMTYDRIFPAWKMLGQPQSKAITVSTVMRNQPYASQTDNTVVRCT